ncbi:GNAT family N-acetyltransferase [Pelagerythrobacter marinus]|uniref:GNAT family N-acetyltransferase n=1 Tax=Pelagerythrobacter marinus TaxID=538382 RepID=UPI002036CD16|nr:GNAT family N-acetyltransferase [Pelagerythrobacter marinus]USA38558.1 GNAT family N-acetyltransferase [Pelagerythrobacter marinus]WPZ07416.1 GNAT family N-acetyltransferase [Pelagerythrobacter marinus]
MSMAHDDRMDDGSGGGSGDRPVLAPMGGADVAEALAIQARIYPPALVESEAVFRDRIALPGGFCLAARIAGRLAGYLLAYRWRAGSPPPIGALAGGAPADGGALREVLFIHDLAVDPAGRGLRLGTRMVERALAAAADAGLREAQLVAVEGAHRYWQRMGFTQPEPTGALRAKLASYGPQARWMTRPISPGGGR